MALPLLPCAQRRMASEDVSLNHRHIDLSATHVLNARWRLRMFHEMGLSDAGVSIWCSTPDGV